jgi:hypothetical protein
MEAERPEGAPRLRSADKAVDRAVKRILGSDRTLDRQELRSRAEEIASRQIGTPDGRLPYDSAETHGEAGPAPASSAAMLRGARSICLTTSPSRGSTAAQRRR